MRKYNYFSVPSIISAAIAAFFLIISCGDMNLSVKGNGEETSSSPDITISGTICLDGDATGTCNDVGVCSDTQWGDQEYCRANGETWHAGADMAIRNAKIYLKNGMSVVKMGKTVQDGTYTILDVKPGTTYTIEPLKDGYSFAPASLDTDQVNDADPTADFTATLAWET
jgi:hypothetical protein